MYIKITSTQFTKWQGRAKGVNVFNAARTIVGDYVVDKNTKADFPEAFTGSEAEASLSITEFPQTKII